MSWIGNLYDHFHDDLNMPELPGMSRDRAQEIVAEAFAPGSPAYHHLRQNSQVAEFLLPGLDLNFEENYSDFYDDLVDTPSNTDGTTDAPTGDTTESPPQHGEEPDTPDPGDQPPPGYIAPLPNEDSDGPFYTVYPEEPVEPGCPEPDGPPGQTPPGSTDGSQTSRCLDQAFRHIAGGDRELSEAELLGAMEETRDPCSPYQNELDSIFGVVDISDDNRVTEFEASTIHSAMDDDGSGSVSSAEFTRFFEHLERTQGDNCPPPQGNDCPPPQIDNCPPPQGNDCPPPQGIDCPPPKSDDCPPQSNECPSPAWANYDFLPYEPDEIGEVADDDRPEQENDGTDTAPDYSGRPPLEGGRRRVEIKDGQIPQELSQYARYENGMLVIDGRGEELPPLQISSDNVIIRNARIKGGEGAAIRIDNSNNVQIEDCEISGGTRGVQAWDSSNISVRNNWLHDFDYREKFDTTAVEFNHVSGGTVAGNRINGLYRSDAVSMYESQNVRVFGNRIDITIDEWSSSPLMVEGSTTNNIEVYDNVINYPVGNNVPPGLLGGTNLRAYNNEVNGNRSVSAWQMYAYNPVWNQVYFDGQLISPN